MKKQVKNSPTKRSGVQKTPAKASPPKTKLEGTPDRRNEGKKKVKSEATGSLKVPQGSILGWNFFLHARPDTHSELNEWMVQTWGSSQPTTRRGFHISGLKPAFREEFDKIYYRVYQTTSITNNEVGTVFARGFAAAKQANIDVDWDSFCQHRISFQRGSVAKSEDSEPLKKELTPAKTESCSGGHASHKIQMTDAQVEVVLKWKMRLETSNQCLEQQLEAAVAVEKDAQEKYSSIAGTCDWIHNKIQTSDSDLLKKELEKEKDKLQNDLNLAKTALESAKQEHKRIREHMSGSNDFLQNTNCLAESLYSHGLRALYPAPIEHPVRPASLLISIECCVYCGLGFASEALDAVITPCLHTYHILCATHHFSYSTECLAQSCGESMSNDWMAAMGFGHTMTQARDGVPYKSELFDGKMPGSIRSEVHESLHMHGSAFSAVKPIEEKPIQSLQPDPSWGFLGDLAEKSGLLSKSVEPALLLKSALSSGDLEDTGEKKGQSSLLETRDDTGDSYNEDDFVKTALQKKELLSSEQTTGSTPQDSSDGDSKVISKKRNAVRQQLYKNKKKLKQDVKKDEVAPISSDSADSKDVTGQGLDSEGKAIPGNVQDQETTAAPIELSTQKDEEIAATFVESTAEEIKNAPSSEEKDTLMNEDAEEHEGSAADELEEATPQTDGDNFKLSKFIPAGFRMRKSRPRSTLNGVHMPKTRSGSK